MALHKHFREYTKKEIEAIKLHVCVKSKCPYLGRLAGDGGDAYKRNKNDVSTCNKMCNYMLYTGKMRGCMPDECTHFNDDVSVVRMLKKRTLLNLKDLKGE